MALSLESAGKVRQKTRMYTLDPSVFYALKGFFLYWATNKGNADLQLKPFSEADADDADGTGLLDAASTLHVVYVKKLDAATDNYVKIFDNATVDTTTTDQRLVLPLFQAKESQIWISNKGLPLAVGATITQHTTSEGTTDGSDGGDGFIIVAAA